MAKLDATLNDTGSMAGVKGDAGSVYSVFAREESMFLGLFSVCLILGPITIV